MQAAWAKQRAAGAYDNKKWAGFDKKRSHKDRIECKNGVVEAVVGDPDQTYKCKNIVSVWMKVLARGAGLRRDETSSPSDRHVCGMPVS